jgi:hypothetical protein
MPPTIRPHEDITVTTTGLQAADRVEAAGRDLYNAECALHTARQSHVDAWIAAASERLHEAIAEHLFAVAARTASASDR